MEKTAEEIRQGIEALLTPESLALIDLNKRIGRTAGLDAGLNNKKVKTMRFIDKMLDRYIVADLDAIPVQEEPVVEPVIVPITKASPFEWEMPDGVELGEE